jgi:hypothetical protein
VDQIVEQYDLSSDKGRPEKDKKCPKIDMTVLKEVSSGRGQVCG